MDRCCATRFDRDAAEEAGGTARANGGGQVQRTAPARLALPAHAAARLSGSLAALAHVVAGGGRPAGGAGSLPGQHAG